ncbi:MAG: COX15/CtaA family protein [Microbacterium sp.]|nr:COX15/CtaA family protein [Microbacterium sp.]
MRTPLGWAASRWSLSPRALRWSTAAALVVAVLIVAGGAIVRVTGSGLGCPTWPTCDGTRVFVPVPDSIHLLIEQTNRAVTGLLVLAVGWVIVAARLQRPRNRAVTRLAWSQFWMVVANAIAGGVSVLLGLNPWVVALHYLLAIGLIATATLTYHRVRSGGADEVPDHRSARLSWVLMAATSVLIVAGTLVTGSGPHSGDSEHVPRMGFDWAAVTWVHAVLGTLVLVLAVVAWHSARASGARILARRAGVLTLVVVLQALVGAAQAGLGLPEWMVAVHTVGAALVWIGAIRVLLDANPSLFSTLAGVHPPRPEVAEPAAR